MRRNVFIIISIFIFLLFVIAVYSIAPWYGKVIDKNTGQPIEGAVLVRSWDVETASPAGTVTSFFGMKETLTDKNGKFTIFKKIYFPGIPILIWISENRPIVFKPGYKFLILDKKTSTISLEKIPTIIDLREKELSEAQRNYEVDHYNTNIFRKMIEREEDFIEHDEKVERHKLSKSNMGKFVIITKNKDSENSGRQRRIGNPKEIESLIHKLRNHDLQIRIRAAETLGTLDIKDPAHLEAIRMIVESQIEAWNDKNKVVRIIPADSLGRIGSPVVEPLLKALNHENPNVRKIAASALAGTDDPRAVNALIAGLDDRDPDMRQKITWALGDTKDPKAVKPLINKLKDEDMHVRYAAARDLGLIGDPAAVKPLINALRDDEESIRTVVEQSLRKIGHPAVEALIEALDDDDWRVRYAAVGVLKNYYEPRVFDAMIGATKDNNSMVLTRVVYALGEFRDPNALNTLIKISNHEYPEVRQRIALALGKIQDQRALETLLKASKDPSWIVRRSAIEALGMMKGEKAINALIEAWNDKDRDVRRIAADVLVEKKAEAVDSLIRVLKHPDPYFRWKSALTLGKIRAYNAVEDLIPLLQDNVSEVKWITIKALGSIYKNRKSVDPLIAILHDNDSGIRTRAVESLRNITGKSFGQDSSRWQTWWQRNKEFYLKPRSYGTGVVGSSIDRKLGVVPLKTK